MSIEKISSSQSLVSKTAMTSRERVLMTINHREPDCVPVDLRSTPSSGISAIAYNNLKKYMGMDTGHNRIYDIV